MLLPQPSGSGFRRLNNMKNQTATIVSRSHAPSEIRKKVQGNQPSVPREGRSSHGDYDLLGFLSLIYEP